MRALESAMGLPNRSTSASSMLGLLMPEEVRRSFMCLLRVVLDPHTVETERPPKTHRLRRCPLQASFRNTGPAERARSRALWALAEPGKDCRALARPAIPDVGGQRRVQH